VFIAPAEVLLREDNIDILLMGLNHLQQVHYV